MGAYRHSQAHTSTCEPNSNQQKQIADNKTNYDKDTQLHSTQTHTQTCTHTHTHIYINMHTLTHSYVCSQKFVQVL